MMKKRMQVKHIFLLTLAINLTGLIFTLQANKALEKKIMPEMKGFKNELFVSSNSPATQQQNKKMAINPVNSQLELIVSTKAPTLEERNQRRLRKGLKHVYDKQRKLQAWCKFSVATSGGIFGLTAALVGGPIGTAVAWVTGMLTSLAMVKIDNTDLIVPENSISFIKTAKEALPQACWITASALTGLWAGGVGTTWLACKVAGIALPATTYIWPTSSKYGLNLFCLGIGLPIFHHAAEVKVGQRSPQSIVLRREELAEADESYKENWVNLVHAS